MPDPVVHLIAGPNGAGKSTFFDHVLGPTMHLPLVNADQIAAERWPDDVVRHAYDASAVAAERRDEMISIRRSFATETVFSHESKLALLRAARSAGYLVTLHVIIVPEELSVARVVHRVAAGGHAVPEAKIRSRFRRLRPLVAAAIEVADTAVVYDNSSASRPFAIVASFERGAAIGAARWPSWAPAELRAIGC